MAPWLVTGAACAALGAAWLLSPAVREQSSAGWDALMSGERAEVSAWVRQLGAWGPVVIVVAATLQMFLIVVPSWLLMVASVVVYGPWLGGLLAFGATLLAAMVGWLLGRLLGPATLHRVIGDRSLERMGALVERYGKGAVFVTRLSPLFSNDAISVVAGVAGMRWWPFLLASAAGLLPLTALLAALGGDMDTLRTGLAWAFGVSLAGLIAWIVWDRRRG